MQSKAVEGFRKDAINPSNFSLHLPASYTQALQKQAGASIILPPGQSVQSFTAKTSGGGAVTTFSLPPGVTYPVHIPAGVTLQTASGHFYKVNVPVVVTQAPRANRVVNQASAVQKAAAPPATPRPQPASTQPPPTAPAPATQPSPRQLAPTGQDTAPASAAPASSADAQSGQRSAQTDQQQAPETAAPPVTPPVSQTIPADVPAPVGAAVVAQKNTIVVDPAPVSQDHSTSNEVPTAALASRGLLAGAGAGAGAGADGPQPSPMPVAESPGDFNLDGIDFSPQVGQESPLNLCIQTPQNMEVKQEQGPLSSCPMSGDSIDLTSPRTSDSSKLKEEAKEEASDAFPVSCDGSAFSSLGNQLDEAIRMELMKDFNFCGLEDLVQLDGACDGSSDEEEEDGDDRHEEEKTKMELEMEMEMDEVPMGENDFLSLISAEALDVLKEAGSSDDEGNASSASSDTEQPVIIEEDPLNSGDDVSDQDVPDLFDTENVVVCLYEKIHRSKNNWKFTLRDGVMTYGGKDYVFSRAIGEAEW
ncbi:TFIIA-alpha and beta-like factor isoform X2 [Engraulis encrasicolus]